VAEKWGEGGGGGERESRERKKEKEKTLISLLLTPPVAFLKMPGS
jgi:hypothetical protein